MIAAQTVRPEALEDFEDWPAAPPPEGLAAKRFRASSLEGTPPARVWFSPGLIPGNNVTLLSGDGGGGKSTLMLQASVAAVLGLPWINGPVQQGPVVYLSAEDDRDELHRRLDAIGLHYGRHLSDMSDLHLIDLSIDDALLAAGDGRGGLVATPLLADLEAIVAEARPVLIVLDSLADVFGGDEIRRDHARRFVGLLRHMAQGVSAALVVLSHPSLSGLSSGTGSSGSTHWSNSVRSRLYLTRPSNEAGAGGNEEVRLLQVKKANYAAAGGEMRLRLRSGAFTSEEPIEATALDRAHAQSRVDAAFLGLLTTYQAEGRKVSHTPGVNYGPTLFARDPRANGIGMVAFREAMGRLFAAQAITVTKDGRESRATNRLTRVEGDRHDG